MIEYIYLWKIYGDGKKHLGKYEADTGKWVKWEPQSNDTAKSQADQFAIRRIFAP